jgi:glutaconate CoA-transferase subunit A
MAVPALNPDVAVIHAQRADRRGNVALWGITGIQKEAALSARRVIVTVEEVVEEFEPRAFGIVLPSVAVSAVAVEPRGAYPSYAHDYYARDNAFYEAWDPVSRDRESFRGWMERHVLGTDDFAGHLRSIEKEEAIR